MKEWRSGGAEGQWSRGAVEQKGAGETGVLGGACTELVEVRNPYGPHLGTSRFPSFRLR